MTPETVATLQAAPRQYYVWDTKHTGFGVRVNASGSLSYVVKLNLPGKRSVWKTLTSSDLAPAVIEYHQLQIKFGRGESLQTKVTETLWQDVVDRFELEHLQNVKPKTALDYKSSFKRIREAFKNRPIRTITYEDAWTFHKDMANIPRQANINLRLTRQIFDRAELWGMRDLNTNPVDMLRKIGWKPYPEHDRQRPIRPEEMVRIGQALHDMKASGENLFAISAVYLLFYLGRRLREVLGIEWRQIDLEARTIRWSDTKTGAASAPLNDEAWGIISSLPRMSYRNKAGEIVEHPYVLPGKNPGKPMTDIRSFWKRLLAKAEVENLWRHDLRHAHGNEAADLDLNPQAIAALLGHADMASTNRYSKTGLDRRLKASQTVAGSLSSRLGVKK